MSSSRLPLERYPRVDVFDRELDEWLDFEVVKNDEGVELWLHSSDNGWKVISSTEFKVTFMDGNGGGPFTEPWRPYLMGV
jgi:hypothetical protein